MLRLDGIIAALEKHYGKPRKPPVLDPLGLVLFENVAYLVDDEQREKAFAALKRNVGLTAKKIADASDEKLLAVARVGGMLPEMRVGKLRMIAQLVQYKFGGDLRPVLKLPYRQAVKALRVFPGIGQPSAEKILCFTGAYPVLGLESNGLRVLLRVGYGQESKNYSATYRSAQQALRGQLPDDCAWLTKAHLLLRQHGQALCKRSQPQCEACPLREGCRYYRQMKGAQD